MTRNEKTDAASGWFSEETATFGDRLAAAREAAGLGKSDLATRLGIRKKTLEAWENDLREPRANRLQMLAGMLNVSLKWLLTGEGPGVPSPDEAAARAPEVEALLPEIRQMRTQMGEMAEALGRLEARLRLAAARDAA
ncbi:MAG: helix-turn-helix transcriptional regulator [Rhodobacteraceae bacterium]|nr:helix-turn-helix transcriptional regulator [Paracoccaceae bacterium]